MESLLSLSFSNLSSRDTPRIRKGLRQIEGLLAHIALSTTKLSPHKHKRKSSAVNNNGHQQQQQQQGVECKKLAELRKDAAFREFFRLQEGFRWNVASRLTATLERLMGQHPTPQTNTATLSTLSLLQGTLLLHPPSRTLFAREDYMNLLLDLLDPTSNPAEIQHHALLVLVTALLDCPRNTRVFEQVDGLLTVTSLFKSRGAAKEVKMRTLEFLYFYLMPETTPTASTSAPNTAVGLQRSPSKLGGGGGGHARTHSGDSSADKMDMDESASETKTTEDKQKLLGRHLSNVAELVQDLRENAVFGAAGAVA